MRLIVPRAPTAQMKYLLPYYSYRKKLYMCEGRGAGSCQLIIRLLVYRPSYIRRARQDVYIFYYNNNKKYQSPKYCKIYTRASKNPLVSSVKYCTTYCAPLVTINNVQLLICLHNVYKREWHM